MSHIHFMNDMLAYLGGYKIVCVNEHIAGIG